MRGTQVVMALLAAGALTLGSGAAMAATGESKAPEAPKAPAVSNSSTAASQQEAKETKAVQQQEKARTTREGKETAVDRIVRGEVTAVESTAKTLTVKVMRGKEPETVGVDVPDTAKITQGKAAKTLADIKVGDRVWMKYDRMSNKLVADQIRILKSGTMAAKTGTARKTY